MDLREYQRLASNTVQANPGRDPKGMSIAALGLVSEAGSVANIVKKFLRDNIDWNTQREFLTEEIGDVLWYLADVASRLDIDLGDVAHRNLGRTTDRFGEKGKALPDLIVLDESCQSNERFPRRMRFRFTEVREGEGKPTVQVSIVEATPNHFPGGQLQGSDGKAIGFTIGNVLNDNSYEDDGYRYHDALHIGLMAVLGWSPVMRALLRLQRKSNPDIDHTEDGARAKDAEEGLSTYLFFRAPRFGYFESADRVGNDTLDEVMLHMKAFEVTRQPTRLWRRAISEGFRAWRSIRDNHGGVLVADLDERTVRYEKL